MRLHKLKFEAKNKKFYDPTFLGREINRAISVLMVNKLEG